MSLLAPTDRDLHKRTLFFLYINSVMYVRKKQRLPLQTLLSNSIHGENVLGSDYTSHTERKKHPLRDTLILSRWGCAKHGRSEAREAVMESAHSDTVVVE